MSFSDLLYFLVTSRSIHVAAHDVISFFLWLNSSPACMPACSVAKLCLTLCDPVDCSPPGSSVHGILQARILEWVAISFSRNLPNSGIEPLSPALAGGFFTTEPPEKPISVRTYIHTYIHTDTYYIFFFLMFIYAFISAVRGPCCCAQAFSGCCEQELHPSLRKCESFSLRLLFAEEAPRSASFSACVLWAQLLHGMWNLLDRGSEPTAPALAGGFLTTGPLGKSVEHIFFIWTDTLITSMSSLLSTVLQ